MPSNTEYNLIRLSKTSMPMDFVREHKGEWDHQAWLDFCAAIEENGYTPIDLDKVGLLLEQKKVEYWAERNSGQ